MINNVLFKTLSFVIVISVLMSFSATSALALESSKDITLSMLLITLINGQRKCMKILKLR